MALTVTSAANRRALAALALTTMVAGGAATAEAWLEVQLNKPMTREMRLALARALDPETNHEAFVMAFERSIDARSFASSLPFQQRTSMETLPVPQGMGVDGSVTVNALTVPWTAQGSGATYRPWVEALPPPPGFPMPLPVSPFGSIIPSSPDDQFIGRSPSTPRDPSFEVWPPLRQGHSANDRTSSSRDGTLSFILPNTGDNGFGNFPPVPQYPRVTNRPCHHIHCDELGTRICSALTEATRSFWQQHREHRPRAITPLKFLPLYPPKKSR